MNIGINAATIGDTAGAIRMLNTQLSKSLETSQATMNSLKSVWEGAAAEATFTAYDQFAAKYFDEYYKLIDQYVQFLEKAAAEGWSDTENKVEQIGESIVSGVQAAADAIS